MSTTHEPPAKRQTLNLRIKAEERALIDRGLGVVALFETTARLFHDAYPAETGQPVHLKRDTRSTAQWAVGAKRRTGWMVFTPEQAVSSIWVKPSHGLPVAVEGIAEGVLPSGRRRVARGDGSDNAQRL